MESRINGVKVRSTFYRPDKVAAARDNIQKYAWAREAAEQTICKADRYVRYGLEGMWSLITSQSLGRSLSVNIDTVCPICGEKAKAFGNYSWHGDCIDMPWKIKCDCCHNLFPSNDFGAYYQSGMDESGCFDRTKADAALLVNTLYPDKPADWCVDDGRGWVDTETNQKYMFVPYYVHWMLYSTYAGDMPTEGAVVDAFQCLCDAYLYTGEEKYAEVGIVLLDRFADVYPEMQLEDYRYKDGYLNCWGTTEKGKVLGCIWEARFIRLAVMAYDAFSPVFQTENKTVLRFLQQKRQQFPRLAEKASMRDIAHNIEQNILCILYQAAQDCEVYGNVGIHQSALAMAAVVYDDRIESKKWLDWVFRPGGLVEKPSFHVTGGDINNVLAEGLDRDGFGNEASPDYNYYWVIHLKLLADVLDGYEGYPGVDLYKNPKFCKLLDSFRHLVIDNNFMPHIGDTAKTGNPSILIKYDNVQSLYDAYGKCRDTGTAQMAYFLNENSGNGLHLNIFEPNAGELGKEIEKVIAREGQLVLQSENLTGYGLCLLRNRQLTTADCGHTATVYYGRTFWHGHRDLLNLELYGYGMNLTPDLGYPEYAMTDCVHRLMWSMNTVSHNTALINASKQELCYSGLPHGFEDFGFVKWTDISGLPAYSCAQQYRRQLVMVPIDAQNCYYVDAFSVEGGTEHHYSFHAAESSAVTTDFPLARQTGGTYAGEAVAFEQKYDDLEHAIEIYSGSGFQYLYDVQKTETPPNAFSVDWSLQDTWKCAVCADVHLKLTMLCNVDDVALAKGNPPRNKVGNPKELTYMMAHRSGKNLQSTFVSVIEPYAVQSRVESTRRLALFANGKAVDYGAFAIEVTLCDGRKDYIVGALDPQVEYTCDEIAFCGAFGFVSLDAEGTIVHQAAFNSSHMSCRKKKLVEENQARYSGKLIDFSKGYTASTTLLAEFDCGQAPNPDALRGRFIYVDNGYADACKTKRVEIPAISGFKTEYTNAHNAVYRIEEAVMRSDNTVLLQLGNQSLVCGLNGETPDGFLYDVSLCDRFEIPLSWAK